MAGERNGYSTTGLPVIPYTLTTTIDGIKYETHVLTNTCQVITEDGITLCDILDNLVTNEQMQEAIKDVGYDNPIYQYKGILLNLPDKSAIDQLYEKVGMQEGDVYLVQCSSSNTDPVQAVAMSLPTQAMTMQTRIAVNRRFDMYSWSATLNEWMFFGSTEKNSLPEDFPVETLQEFPQEFGRPGQVVTVSTDGASLTWAYPNAVFDEALKEHNRDPMAHPEIWEAIDKKADKLKIFNATLYRDNWAWLGDDCYSYVFEDPNIPRHSYFEITPIAIDKVDLDVLTEARIRPIYKIEDSDKSAYAIIRAEHVPTKDINVCVKLFGAFLDA